MNRRIAARACIAIGLACIAVVLTGHHARTLGFSTIATGVLSIGGALVYLRSDRRPVSTRMSKTDRAAWQSARTLAGLGELTARWLEGPVASVPGYCCRPAEETEGLVTVLARLNRAGFVTTGSQPGETGDGWEQRAAVEGFATWAVAAEIETAAVHADLIAIVHDPADLPRWRYYSGEAVTVTKTGGRDFTGFGVQVPRCHIRSPHLAYFICRPDAVDALCQAWQVTVIDPEWGRPDVLWEALTAALCQAVGDNPEGTVHP